MEAFLHSPTIWKKAVMGSGFHGKDDTLFCEVPSVLVRSISLTLKTALLHLSLLLGAGHRRKCRAGHGGELYHTALTGCPRHLEMPWGQLVPPASPPARHWASGVKSLVSSAFSEIREGWVLQSFPLKIRLSPVSQGCHLFLWRH